MGATGNTVNVSVVETYEALTRYLEGFRDGHLQLLVLIGSWGIGKSRLVKELVGADGCWIEGSSTAFGVYSSLYQCRDQPVVIDDVDSIYSDRHCVSLLKSVCGTEPKKRVHWNASGKFLEREGLPREFTTGSRVLIICNEWKTLNRNVAALEDRGVVLRFEPSPEEVHARAATWFKDPEIYDWFAGQLHRIQVHSFRYYIKAAQLKACGIPWKTVITGVKGKDLREKLVRHLLAEESFANMEERAKAFTKRGGGSRGTFFSYKRRIEAGEL